MISSAKFAFGTCTAEKQRLRRLARICVRQLRRIGIYPPDGIGLYVQELDEMRAAPGNGDIGDDWLAFTVNRRRGKQWIDPIIYMLPSVLHADVSDESCMHIIMHELLHACAPEEDDHGGRWLQFAEIVNEKLGYDIREHASYRVSREIERVSLQIERSTQQPEQVSQQIVRASQRKTQPQLPQAMPRRHMNILIQGDVHVQGSINVVRKTSCRSIYSRSEDLK